MKKYILINNKGFVLAETLVVAVSISLIFALVFKNFYPLMGEYEKRENYDDLDSKYGTYWIKKLVQSSDYNFAEVDTDINNKGYSQFSCDKLSNAANKSICKELIEKLEVSCDINSNDDYIDRCNNPAASPRIYITKFSFVEKDIHGNITLRYKDKLYNRTELSEDLKNYLRYLPEYSKISSLNKAQYRIIIEYYRHRFDTQYVITSTNPTILYDKTKYILDEDNDFKTFSNIEVKRG